MAKRFKLNKGDVFTIPLNEKEVGFGQVVSEYDKKSGGFLIAVFSFRANSIENIMVDDICRSEIVFLGFTFDAKLYHGHWVIIGNYIENIPDIEKPYFKLGTPPDEIYLINMENERLAKISEATFEELDYKTEIAPIYYEEALKSHFGLLEWNSEEYDGLLYKHTLKSSQIAKRVLSSN